MESDSFETVECGGSRGTGRRLVALIFKRDQLIYDVENNCYVEGHIMVESDDEVRHMVQDVVQEGNVDRVTRVLDLAHADITERLYPLTQHEVHHPVLDDRLREKPVYALMLNVPEYFSQTTVNLLGKLIHELLVCTATADWLSITNPPKEETWRRKAESALTRINQVKGMRPGRSRIRPHWL